MIGISRRALLANGIATVMLDSSQFARGAALPEAPVAAKLVLRDFIRIRGSLDGQLVIGCLSGIYHGVVEGELRPMYGVIAATFSTFAARDDGRFDAKSYEIAYFTDVESGNVLDSFLNPYTGETVQPLHVFSPASKLIYNQDLSFTLAKSTPGLQLEHKVKAPVVIGNDLVIAEVTTTEAQIPGRPQPFRYSEVLTLQARARDLADPTLAHVPARVSFSAVVQWRPWLKMEGRPGHLFGAGAGTIGLKLSDLPREWQRATQERHPEIWADPSARLNSEL
jgi:hypothetical protein